MNNYLLNGYEALVPPFALEYDTWSPEKAEELYQYTEEMAKERYEEYLKLAERE